MVRSLQLFLEGVFFFTYSFMRLLAFSLLVYLFAHLKARGRATAQANTCITCIRIPSTFLNIVPPLGQLNSDFI